jgi:DHA2 family multidrug resistance protein
MGNATSIFNVMRNLGGSIGIAGATTLVARDSQTHINVLGAHVTMYDMATRQMLEAARAGFIAKGMDIATATRQAYAAVFGMIAQQSAMISFNAAFLLLGILFLVVTPLILLMRKPKHKGAATAAH